MNASEDDPKKNSTRSTFQRTKGPGRSCEAMAKQDKPIVISKNLVKETLQDADWCATAFSSLLEDPTTHDVTFKTSDGGSVSAHRVIVAVGSPVFHAMLFGNMKESSQKEIALPTVDTSTLKLLLTFVYTGRIKIDSDSCMSILDTACYFNVAALEAKCTDFIIRLLNTENCCYIVTIANAKKFDVLLKKCLEFLFQNCDKIIINSTFYSLSTDLILTICQSSSLRVNEIDLFLAIVEWHKHQKTLSNSEKENIFQQIRYPMISISNLLQTVRPLKIADPVLYTSALEYHHMPDTYDGPPNQLVPRKYFILTNMTPNTMTTSSDGSSVTVTKSGASGWSGLSVFQVYPTELYPVHFTIDIKPTNADPSGFRLAVRTCALNELNPKNYSGGVDGRVGGTVKGTIAIRNRIITTTIGGRKFDISKQSDGIYICVYLYYTDDSVVFTNN